VTPRHPLVAWILGWLLPGAGHWYIGQGARAAVLAGALVGSFAAGVLIGGRGTVSTSHPEYLVLQWGAGAPAGIAWAAGTADPTDIPVSRRDLGMLYTLVPALLNLVVAMDAAARAAGANPGDPPAAAEPAPAPAEEPPPPPVPDAPAAPAAGTEEPRP